MHNCFKLEKKIEPLLAKDEKILFMANFTHIFEEAATSFILFMLIGGYIAKESRDFRKEK